MKVDDYSLIKKIGEGAFGEVYLTQKEKDFTLYATKKIRKQYIVQNNLERYLNNELNILIKVKHPNIIKFHKIKETINHYYLIFENCNGGTLTDFMLKYKNTFGKNISEHDARPIFKQITSGLQYLHSKNILHRDIKPDNILINYIDPKKDMFDINNIQIKIIDFGFARYLKDNEIAMSTLGSPLHMDPRILKKMKKIEDFKFYGYKEDADIWSLGCILYEMLIGFPPFYAETYEELLDKLNKGNYTIPTQLKISKQAIALVNGMLQQDPKSRLNINEVVNHMFFSKDPSEFDYFDLKKIAKPINLSKSQCNFILNTDIKDIWSLFIDEKDENIKLSKIITEHNKIDTIPEEASILEKLSSLEIQQESDNTQGINIKSIEHIDYSLRTEIDACINSVFELCCKEVIIEESIYPIFPSYRM